MTSIRRKFLPERVRDEYSKRISCIIFRSPRYRTVSCLLHLYLLFISEFHSDSAGTTPVNSWAAWPVNVAVYPVKKILIFQLFSHRERIPADHFHRQGLTFSIDMQPVVLNYSINLYAINVFVIKFLFLHFTYTVIIIIISKMILKPWARFHSVRVTRW